MLWDLGVGFCCFFESVDLVWVIPSFYHGLKVTMEVLSGAGSCFTLEVVEPQFFLKKMVDFLLDDDKPLLFKKSGLFLKSKIFCNG